MSNNILKEIKEEAKKINELIKEDKEKIKKINDIDKLFTVSFTILFLIFVPAMIFINGIETLNNNRFAPIILIFLVSFSALFSFLISGVLNLIIKNKIKNTANSYIKHLSNDYWVSKEKKLYFYNKYQELKNYSKDYLCYKNYYEKKLSLEEREKQLAKLYIESKDYRFLINYLKEENKELVFEKEYIQNFIYKKTKNKLENIKDINEFNNIKEDLIYVIDLIELIDKKLELFQIMEKLKEKYDSEVINKKIGNIKDKLLNKSESHIEIKKATIRSI